ncbi:MAG: bifunctional UDP-N-acetylglucosamine pyrophosphorylase/glucosamine-1-phosphate N-acetyltransferase [Hyphomicrobiaceae bacterium]|jgi:bifunctional UDP-N-acetylglucosamine pyrophosphorylase/glucosamine-1-phosphate N-acetyltransferase
MARPTKRTTKTQSQQSPQSPQSPQRGLAAIVLAAGQGTRMRSDRAKVLHELGGRPMVSHVLSTLKSLKPDRSIVVVGHQADEVRAILPVGVDSVLQAQRLGTAHAALQARPRLSGFVGEVLVLNGDVPLVTTATLRSLVRRHRRDGAKATVLSMVVDDPTGYGRIVREADGRLRIVEHADASTAERAICEVNSGMYCFDGAFLRRALGQLGRDNAQGEYYLTDLLEVASSRGAAACHIVDDESETLGINSRLDLAQAEAILQDRLIARALAAGVTMLDPSSVHLGTDVRIGRDTVIGPNVRLEGSTRIGKGCTLDGSIFLRDTTVGDDVLLRWGSVADGARVARGARIGPYAHLRPEADLGEDVHIGNFVEVKKSKIGRGSKANHLTYIGDTTVGRDANIGAGTITCNYDGTNKHRTVIGDRVQIGSDTQLVAPVSIGNDAYIAAGSTITREVGAFALGFNDKPQRNRDGWVRGFRDRQKKESGKGTAGKKGS